MANRIGNESMPVPLENGLSTGRICADEVFGKGTVPATESETEACFIASP
jgi:hypothetical protein